MKGLNIENGIDIKAQYVKHCVLLLFLSSIIQASVGFARDGSPIVKLIIAALAWGGIILSYQVWNGGKNQKKHERWLIKAIFALTIFAFVRSFLFGEVSQGDKDIVLLTNMSAFLDLTGIFFLFTAQYPGVALRTLYKISIPFILVSAIFFFTNFKVSSDAYFSNYVFMYGAVFAPLIDRKRLPFVALALYLCYLSFQGGGRQAAIIAGGCILSWIVGKYFGKKTTFAISILICIIPFILIFWSIKNGSIFETMADQDVNYETRESMINEDTRTFLYTEAFQDYIDQDRLIQLFGKGSFSYYYSDFFYDGGEGLTSLRFGIEVPVLQWIIQSGLVYIILFTILIVLSVWNLSMKSNSRFCRTAAVQVSCFYLYCFIAMILGCNIGLYGIWLLIGLGFNHELLAQSDREILKAIKTDTTKRHAKISFNRRKKF